jgi:hypothetical protein
MAIAASFIATHVYYVSLEDGEKGIMDQSIAWAIVVGLSSSALVGFTAFLLLMKREFWGTFFSLQTGCQYVQSKFLREGDENKKAVFK